MSFLVPQRQKHKQMTLVLKQEWSRVQFSGEGTCQQLHHAYLYLFVLYSPYKPALFLAPSAIFCSNCFICSRHLENFLELSNSVALWDLGQNWVLSCKLAARACNFKFCKNPKNYCMLGGPIHPQTSGCFSQDAGSRMANQKHNNTLVCPELNFNPSVYGFIQTLHDSKQGIFTTYVFLSVW